VTGISQIDGDLYFFDDNGVMLANKWRLDVDECAWTYYDNSGRAADGWKKIDNNWYYFEKENENKPALMISNGMYKINGLYYYFDSDGIMQKGGWKKIDDRWVFLGPDGAALTGWQQISGKWYFFGGNYSSGDSYEDRYMATGFINIDGKTYYFDKNTGAMKTGWIKLHPTRQGYIDLSVYLYADENGILAEGWKQINGKWYYFGANGGEYFYNSDVHAMLSGGLYTIDGNMYYFDNSGARVSNYWYKDIYTNKWMYFNKNGVAVDNWQTIDGKAYYFHNNYMQTGFTSIDDYTYYFDEETGVRKTGLQKIGDGTYFFDEYGRAYKGWKTINGNTYYFNSIYPAENDGKTNIGGNLYYFNADGVMQTNFWKDGTYYSSNGAALKEGIYKIGSNTYIFSDYKFKTGVILYNGNDYWAGEDGALVSGWCSFKSSDGIRWYYYNPDFTLFKQEGWQRIEGKVYYFEWYHARFNGPSLTLWDVTYYFDDNGVCKNPPAGV